jgi:hypothetical protein
MAMAIVQGIREQLQLPLYDCLTVEPGKQLRDKEPSSTLRFFVNVQNKTKLETNLQSASLLPHYNTFEARAMRVVISDLPPEFPEDDKKLVTKLEVTSSDDEYLKADGTATDEENEAVTADFNVSLDRLMRLLKEARRLRELDTEAEPVTVDVDDPDVTIKNPGGGVVADKTVFKTAGGTVNLFVEDIEDALKEVFDRKAPPKEQIFPNDGVGTLIGKFIYNTVTTLYVGEKIMIQMPTWFFPSGAGPYSEAGKVTTHGEPSPTSTFRFAEAIFIDRQQNFRVEIEVPDADVLKEMQQVYGPLFIWVVLDGYMTRGVQ